MRSPRFVPLAFAVVLLVPAIAHAEVWEKRFPVRTRPTVRVAVRDAKVRVHAHSGATVDARVELTGRATGFYLRKVKPDVRLEHRGDVIEVTAKFSGSSIVFIGTSTWRFVVDVAVPADCDVVLEGSDGPVTIEGVRGRVHTMTSDGALTVRDVAGDLDIQIGDGRLEVTGVDGRLNLSGNDGPARVSGRFDRLMLHHSDGRLDVEVGPGSKMAEAWFVTTRDGRLGLVLPRDLAATLDAHTRDGRLMLKLPNYEFEANADDRALRIELNGGGPVLKVRSSDGGVTITTGTRAS